jgi:hypothetical protein
MGHLQVAGDADDVSDRLRKVPAYAVRRVDAGQARALITVNAFTARRSVGW